MRTLVWSVIGACTLLVVSALAGPLVDTLQPTSSSASPEQVLLLGNTGKVVGSYWMSSSRPQELRLRHADLPPSLTRAQALFVTMRHFGFGPYYSPLATRYGTFIGGARFGLSTKARDVWEVRLHDLPLSRPCPLSAPSCSPTRWLIGLIDDKTGAYIGAEAY